MLKCAYESLAVGVLIFILTIIRHNPSAYNIDLRNAQVFRDPMPGKRASYFGFSVALYVVEDESLLLVGAPRANSSQLQFVTEPGTVFQCKLNESRCTEWPIYKTGNSSHSHERLSQIKDNAWIGATINIMNNTFVKVCGLQRVSKITKEDIWSSIWYRNSICYLTDNINAKAFEREVDSRIVMNTTIAFFILEVQSFGYAMSNGYYFDEQMLYYASSAPRDAHMYGLIFIYTSFFEDYRMVNGRQYGEYFGAVLTSCDVNNDRKDELIVGAPQWSRDMDEGCVYIFTAPYGFSEFFLKRQIIEGEIAGGRFGSTVTCLGDIDHDGYGDIAVGAPYEEESGGAVYIFNGNRDGVSRKYSQRLVGSRFSPGIRGFGISISKSRNMYRDYLPNIVVGAHQSGEVVLLKSMPVVTINVTLVSKKLPNLKYSSFNIDIQLSHSYMVEYDCLQVKITLKLDQTYHRARLIKNEWYSELFEPSQTMTRTINLKESIQNIKNPFEISVSVQLDNDGNSCCTSCVINMSRSKTEDIIQLPFANFENDISDLNVTLSTDSSPDNTYVIGSTPIIMLHIDIYNHGDPAYQTEIHIFIEILMLASILPDCIEDSRINSTLTVICDVGNLPSKTKKRLTLQLDMSMVRYDVKNIKLKALISTQSNELNLDDNTHVITVYLKDIVLKITGKAQESLYSYLSSYVNEKRTPNSITFQHFYEVQNFGSSPVEEAVFTVKIPTHISRPDTGRIAIVKNITIRMDGYELDCVSHQAEVSFALKKFTHRTIMKNSSSIANDNTHVKFSSIRIPPANRTFYINCTSSAVYCTQFDCKLRPFLNSLSVAKFLVTLDLQQSNFSDDMIEDKDIIFYVTEGRVNITQPYCAQRNDHKLNTLVATKFLGPLLAQRISLWLIAFSIFLGLVLLTLLTLCLRNFGFFDRPDLGLLKAESDLCLKIVD